MYVSVLVQTALSLPPTLPEHVQAVLRPFFNTVDVSRNIYKRMLKVIEIVLNNYNFVMVILFYSINHLE